MHIDTPTTIETYLESFLTSYRGMLNQALKDQILGPIPNSKFRRCQLQKYHTASFSIDGLMGLRDLVALKH